MLTFQDFFINFLAALGPDLDEEGTPVNSLQVRVDNLYQYGNEFTLFVVCRTMLNTDDVYEVIIRRKKLPLIGITYEILSKKSLEVLFSCKYFLLYGT
jgi:hypothetical protein